jgi:hypothetical protein
MRGLTLVVYGMSVCFYEESKPSHQHEPLSAWELSSEAFYHLVRSTID